MRVAACRGRAGKSRRVQWLSSYLIIVGWMQHESPGGGWRVCDLVRLRTSTCFPFMCVIRAVIFLYPVLLGLCTAGWSLSVVLFVGLSALCKCSFCSLCGFVCARRSLLSLWRLGVPLFISKPRRLLVVPDRHRPCTAWSGRRSGWPLWVALLIQAPGVCLSSRKNLGLALLGGIQK